MPPANVLYGMAELTPVTHTCIVLAQRCQLDLYRGGSLPGNIKLCLFKSSSGIIGCYYVSGNHQPGVEIA